MEIQSVIDMRKEMRQEGVIMAYNGEISDELMVSLGVILRNHFEAMGDGQKKALSVFSVFVEQVQNLIWHTRGEERAAGMIVIAEPTCMVRVLADLAKFYAHESCGQCTPCREGTNWLYQIVHRIETGEGKPEDLDMLLSICSNICGRTICALGDAAAFPVMSFLKHFRSEFEYHIQHKTCLVPKDVQRAGSTFHRHPNAA